MLEAIGWFAAKLNFDVNTVWLKRDCVNISLS